MICIIFIWWNFWKSKKIWGYVSRTVTKPIVDKYDYATLLDNWEVDKSKIIVWINNFVEYSIYNQVAKYDASKEVWEHLARLYTQSNFTKKYKLESSIRAHEYKNMIIQEFYLTTIYLWDQLALTKLAEL